jgi:hypothetical protein
MLVHLSIHTLKSVADDPFDEWEGAAAEGFFLEEV